MRLFPLYCGPGRYQKVVCAKCSKVIYRPEDGVADLDGPAYKSFYHNNCVKEAVDTSQ